jgi:hypothetical protein
MRRRVLLGALLVSAGAQAQPRHWLVGRWEGAATGAGGSEGPGRVLLVEAVEADGRVRGSFANTGGGQRTTAITLQGQAVTIVTGQGNTIPLTRVGNDRLEGEYTSTSGRGRRVTVGLTRQG